MINPRDVYFAQIGAPSGPIMPGEKRRALKKKAQEGAAPEELMNFSRSIISSTLTELQSSDEDTSREEQILNEALKLKESQEDK